MEKTYKPKELRKMQNLNFKTKDLYVTDDRKKMEETGRRIYRENPHIYGEKVIKDINDFIDEVMPGLSGKDRDTFFNCSIYDYWVYGASIREYFYYDFVHKNHEEKSQYLTMRKRILLYDHLNGPEREICINKWKAYNHFKEFFKRDIMLIDENADKTAWEEFEKFVGNNPEFIIKPVDLGEGCGVEKMSLSDFDGDKRLMFEEVKKKREAILKEHSWGEMSAVMLEEVLIATDAMKAIHPQSPNFVRCPTILANGKVNIYHPWLLCGNGGEFFIRGFGNYNCAGIEPRTGIIETRLCNEHREFYEYHPDTHIKIPGFAIPKWDELIDTVTKMANMLPTVRYIGWDMVLTDKYGWVPIEANDDGEPLWQLCYDRGFKNELEELIGWKLDDSKFWWEMV